MPQMQHLPSKPRWATFSLGPILVDYAICGAIIIAHSDCDGGDEDGRAGVHLIAKSGGHCAAKATPPIKTSALRVLQDKKGRRRHFDMKSNSP